MGRVAKLGLASLAAVLLFGQPPQEAPIVVNVPATSNPYLAGMPRNSTASLGDWAPQQSPVLVKTSLADAAAICFAASGGVDFRPDCPPNCYPPDGSVLGGHTTGAENGISDITAPHNSLVGVFLGDDRPDRSRAPRPLDFALVENSVVVSPELKQVFFIGSGLGKKGVPRRYMVPAGATRLFLGIMDGYQWNNNSGFFTVRVSIERMSASSSLFSVDTEIQYSKFACLPDRSQCTPERAMVEETGNGQYHVVVPAQLEWGASVPAPIGATVRFRGVAGIVCLKPGSCNKPQGNGTQAGEGYLVPTGAVGALVYRTTSGRIFFSVNDRSGAAFQDHEGYFEFDVIVH